MAKTNYIAIDPAGQLHTRKTERVYTHTVLFKYSYEDQMREANRDQSVDGDNWEFSCRMVEWGGVYRGKREKWHSDEEIARNLATNEALKAKANNRAEAIANGRAERVAHIEARKAAGFYEKWVNAGWCGRLDLAQKLAAKYSGSVIIEANPRLTIMFIIFQMHPATGMSYRKMSGFFTSDREGAFPVDFEEASEILKKLCNHMGPQKYGIIQL